MRSLTGGGDPTVLELILTWTTQGEVTEEQRLLPSLILLKTTSI